MKPIITIEYPKSEYNQYLEYAKGDDEYADVDDDLLLEVANSVGISAYTHADYIVLLTDENGTRTGDTLCLKG